MNYFDLLPNEDLFQICQTMDTESLIRLSKTSHRFKETCERTLNERKRELDKLVDLHLEKIKATPNVAYKFVKKINDEITATLEIDLMVSEFGDLYEIYLVIRGSSSLVSKDELRNVPWILPGIKYGEIFYKYSGYPKLERNIDFKEDENLVRKAIRNAILQGYK